MSIEEKLLRIMEASSTVLVEAKKEESPWATEHDKFYVVGDHEKHGTIVLAGPYNQREHGKEDLSEYDGDTEFKNARIENGKEATNYKNWQELKEAKKEDAPEKEEADEVDQEPAVKIDNPLTPDLTTSENGEVPPEEEEAEEESDEKKEVKESTHVQESVDSSTEDNDYMKSRNQHYSFSDWEKDAKEQGLKINKQTKTKKYVRYIAHTGGTSRFMGGFFHKDADADADGGYGDTGYGELEKDAKAAKEYHFRHLRESKESTDELLEGFKPFDKSDYEAYTDSLDMSSGSPAMIKKSDSGDYVASRTFDNQHHIVFHPNDGGEYKVLHSGDENHIKSKLSLKESTDDLSEEFKIKTQALFEATVSEKVNTLLEEKQQALQVEFDNKLNEAVASFETELTEKIDGYFGELSEKWMQDNEIVLEASLRSELTESFMDGMRKLFESHYVDLPVEKFDIVTSLEEQLNATKESLDSTKALLEQRQKELDSANRENILNETTQGLTEIESGKFKAMMEEFEFDNAENYSKRAEIIKESFFGPGKKELIKKNPEKQTLELSTQPLHEEVTNVGNDKPLSEVSAYAEYMKKQTKNAL